MNITRIIIKKLVLNYSFPFQVTKELRGITGCSLGKGVYDKPVTQLVTGSYEAEREILRYYKEDPRGNAKPLIQLSNIKGFSNNLKNLWVGSHRKYTKLMRITNILKL